FVQTFLLQSTDPATLIQFYTIENYLEGSFHKYNGNNGYKTAIVVDMQGNNHYFTDPKLHTSYNTYDAQFSVGNRYQEGIEDFFKTHVCNNYCKTLELEEYQQDKQ
ncbi:25796_t:CDS:2, partial [Racocetra persica]